MGGKLTTRRASRTASTLAVHEEHEVQMRRAETRAQRSRDVYLSRVLFPSSESLDKDHNSQSSGGNSADTLPQGTVTWWDTGDNAADRGDNAELFQEGEISIDIATRTISPVRKDFVPAADENMSSEEQVTVGDDGMGEDTEEEITGKTVTESTQVPLLSAEGARVPLLSVERSVVAAFGPTTKKYIRQEGKARPKSFQPLGRYDRSSSFHDEVDRQAKKVQPEDHHFPFENLVFEGGGNKGLAYCGAVRYLEEQGMMDQIKCLAGASAGGMFAALLAVGYNSHEIEQFLSDRIDKIFLDASCGYCSLLPNLVRNFGWNPGTRIFEWFGDKLYDKTKKADITFLEVYQRYGKLLCIVVTNLNQMTTEYCHPKTTPNMPVRTAVRMSMAIPGLFSATRYEHFGNEDVYVDGGVLCNYPIHCFDGWYLSMDPRDSFVRRLQPLRDIPRLMERRERFGQPNDKTLGMLLYSDAEEDILRISLERRVGCLIPAEPSAKTKLFEEQQKKARVKERAEREHAKVVQAVDSFLRVLKIHNIDRNDVIDRHELENAFQDTKEFPREEAEVLFGKDFTVQQAFALLDTDDNGQIRYDELVRFIEANGVSLQSRFLGYERREISNVMSFLSSLQSTLIFNVKKLYVKNRDLDRTVGINTGHIKTTDFVLEEPDRDFVVQRGYNSIKSFLRYYVARNPSKAPRKSQSGACPAIPEVPSDTSLDRLGQDNNENGHLLAGCGSVSVKHQSLNGKQQAEKVGDEDDKVGDEAKKVGDRQHVVVLEHIAS